MKLLPQGKYLSGNFITSKKKFSITFLADLIFEFWRREAQVSYCKLKMSNLTFLMVNHNYYHGHQRIFFKVPVVNHHLMFTCTISVGVSQQP